MPRYSYTSDPAHGLIVHVNGEQKPVPEITDYIDAAVFGDIKNKSELARELGITPQSLSNWGRRGMFPSDDHMLRLADLLNVNRAAALMHLNIWRAPGEAATVYKGIFETITKTAASIFPALFLLETFANKVTQNISTLYIM